MRIMLAAIVALGLAGPAFAADPPNTTAQCIEPGGRLIPAVCQTPGSRIPTKELICNCPNGGLRVVTPVCGKGETPPPEGKALMIARRDAAKDGSLVGDLFEGKPICVRPRAP
jgi:hypothetical protein